MDGRLGEAERDAVEAHLGRCPRCVAEVQECRELLTASALLPASAAAARARSLVVKSLRRQHPPVVWRVALRWSAVAALAVAASYLGLGAGRRTAQDRQTVASSLGRAAGADLTGEAEPAGDALAMLMGGEAR